jgi:HEAT repeat protein
MYVAECGCMAVIEESGMQTDVNELIESLTGLLEDYDWNIRMDAVRRLNEMGGAKAVEPLIKMLGDIDGNVRQRAVEALVRIGEPTIGPLIEALDDVDVRRAAARALGEIGESAIEPLIEALDEDDREGYTKAVARAFGWIGGEWLSSL